MKNIVRNSIALICCSALLFLASCEKENIDETQTTLNNPNGNGGEFDCPELQLNIEDFCQTEGVEEGYVNENCQCVEQTSSEPDCPDFYFEGWSDGNVGSPCETPDVPQGGVINENCECEEVEPSLDCPDFYGPGNGLNFGDPCETPAVPMGGTVDENCDCIGNSLEFDCPNLEANFGDACNSGGVIGIIDENCDCITEGSELDCPGLGGNIGDPCQGGWGIISQGCECIENVPGEVCEETTNLADWYPLEFPNGFILSVGEQCWTANDEEGTVSENCECVAD